MTPRQLSCETVKDLLLESRLQELEAEECRAVELHISNCVGCTAHLAAINFAKQTVHSILSNILAGPDLVRATQLHTRAYAIELRQEEERMSPLWISAAAAGAWALLSLPLAWQGFEWIGHHAELPTMVWQSSAVVAWLMPVGMLTAFTLYMRGENALVAQESE